MGFMTRFYWYANERDRNDTQLADKLQQLRSVLSNEQQCVDAESIDCESCFYVSSKNKLSESELELIHWLIEPATFRPTYGESQVCEESKLLPIDSQLNHKFIHVEIGPRLTHSTPFASNALAIVRSALGIDNISIDRIERSTIYRLKLNNKSDCGDEQYQNIVQLVAANLHDRMVECVYEKPIDSFSGDQEKNNNKEDDLQQVDICGGGADELRAVSQKLGLALDEWDINLYVELFAHKLGRNPTLVECFDLAQSNSEHSRHWFFKGILDIEGREQVNDVKQRLSTTDEQTITQVAPSIDNNEYYYNDRPCLFDMVSDTQRHSNANNVIAFADNSSAIKGFDAVKVLAPANSTCASRMLVKTATRHIIFTAETHNFPTGVSPFAGAATGVGGRVRDVHATGRGAHCIAGTAGYSFGSLESVDGFGIDDGDQWKHYPGLQEARQFGYASRQMATPVRIAIEASNGASDYGNKFGEPIISGFSRSFGLRMRNGERWEYVKPIMFTGGIGSIDGGNIRKVTPATGMRVAKIGGPVYRIGMGGGSASSAVGATNANDDNQDELNFRAVQRGDPEMEQKLNRIIRGAIEFGIDDDNDGGENPILSIHDQGAGGNGNVLKEIVEPLGAVIDTKSFTLGDQTCSTLELWTAEYQESDAILTQDGASSETLNRLARREKCAVDFVGKVTGDGRIRLIDSSSSSGSQQLAIDLELEHVIGKMPRKHFKLRDYRRQDQQSIESQLRQQSEHWNIDAPLLSLSANGALYELIRRVLRVPSVASKRWLTVKVDRCVTGLVAQQQCVGPLHTPVADYACVAMSQFELSGAATAIGEQPIKGLTRNGARANAHMSTAEAITNLMFCAITSLRDVKCSANWMWAAKVDVEGSKLVDTCAAMCSLMNSLGMAIDGGKDSLSMSAHAPVTSDTKDAGNQELVKAPGTLVISAYAPVPDIRLKVTPVLRALPAQSHLLYVNMTSTRESIVKGQTPGYRLAGSALLQSIGRVHELHDAPEINEPQALIGAFEIVQSLIVDGICTAGHDVSDGGLAVCLIEMALASHCGLQIDLPYSYRSPTHQLHIVNRHNRSDNWPHEQSTNESRHHQVLTQLFAEECACVIEVSAKDGDELTKICQRFADVNVDARAIGYGSYTDPRVVFKHNGQSIVEYADNCKLRNQWEYISERMDQRQAARHCVQSEYAPRAMSERPIAPDWRLTFDPDKQLNVDKCIGQTPCVAVVREEGTNGDREMCASLAMVGFNVFDVTLTDLLNGQSLMTGAHVKGTDGNELLAFQGIIFPGGFSYGDVFGSARGFGAAIQFNDKLRTQLDRFCRRSTSFTFGVCNGCQLMSLLGILTKSDATDQDANQQQVRLVHNDSGRFECRFVNVRIEPETNAIMLRDMQNSVMGVWIAHAEGKFQLSDTKLQKQVALRYVDDAGQPTEHYPLNPNGSTSGVAGLCSPDGRHLAMMPHPERCTKMWQWPYVVPALAHCQTSPWLQMFKNAYDFCLEQTPI